MAIKKLAKNKKKLFKTYNFTFKELKLKKNYLKKEKV